MSDQHTKEALELHRKMVELGDGKSADVVTALALTLAYAIKYHAAVDLMSALNTFNRLVILEIVDPNSEMCKPQ